MSPFFSIILPTFNRVHVLPRAIDSVISQTFDSWELIVVDNQSTDSTEQYLSSLKDSRITKLSVRNNGIIAVSRNLGILHSSGSYIAFLDSDDWWLPDRLAQVYIAAKDGADLIHQRMYTYYAKQNRIRCKHPLPPYPSSVPILDRLLALDINIVNSSAVVSSEIFSGIGTITENPLYSAFEDLHTWLSIAQHTEKFCYLAEPGGYITISGDNFYTSKSNEAFLALSTIYSEFSSFALPQSQSSISGALAYRLLLVTPTLAFRQRLNLFASVFFSNQPPMTKLKALYRFLFL